MLRSINQTIGSFMVAAVVVGATVEAFAGTLYVLGQPSLGASNQTTSFGAIDTSTGTYTPIALSDFVTGTNLANLAYNPGISRFYVSTGDSTADSTLRTLSTSGSVSSSIGTISKSIYAMWYSSVAPHTSGTLRAYNRSNQDVGTISTTTGAYTLVANSNVTVANRIGGRGSILSGVNYFISANSTAANSAFGSINLATGAFTSVATGTAFQNMVLASDGVDLYGLTPVSTGTSLLYKIASNGALTKVADVKPASGNVPLQYSGAAFAVPEPSAVALAVSGVAALLAATTFRRGGSGRLTRSRTTRVVARDQDDACHGIRSTSSRKVVQGFPLNR